MTGIGTGEAGSMARLKPKIMGVKWRQNGMRVRKLMGDFNDGLLQNHVASLKLMEKPY